MWFWLISLVWLRTTEGGFLGWNWMNLWDTPKSSPTSTAAPIQIQVYENGDSINYQNVLLSPSDCVNDLTFLGAITAQWNQRKRPGSYFSEVAIPVKSCQNLQNGSKLFFVDDGRIFIWPSFELGHRAIALSVKDPPNKNPVVLETLSTSPRVFRIYNFFTEEDSDALVQNALKLTEEDYRLKRSSTGTNGYSIDDKRTSENAFDLSSDVAMTLKKRCFELLGIQPYEETWADGLQILRYNQTTAYLNHLDYIESNNPDHDWDSAGTGTNRFATIVLYMSDVESGGETFFPQAKEWFERDHEEYVQRNTCPDNQSESSCMYPSLTPTRGKIVYPKQFSPGEEDSDTTKYLEENNISHLFPPKSWQKRMVGHCRSKMAVRPLKAEAVLFYSQHPNGQVDLASLHGGCPVLKGTKWAANLWVWNGPRMPYLLQMRKRNSKKNSIFSSFTSALNNKNNNHGEEEEAEEDESTPSPQEESSILAIFSNDAVDREDMRLYWEGTDDMGDIGFGQVIHLNTYVGHSFRVISKGEVLQEFRIKPKSIGGSTQTFVVGSSPPSSSSTGK